MTAADAAAVASVPHAARLRQRIVAAARSDSTRSRPARRPARAICIACRLWWLKRMIATPAPLQEKMTLFLHGHFTSRARSRASHGSRAIRIALFRQYALGNLRELTRDVSKDAAMLIYLDGNVNVAAHPNENYARELMELFTLGIDQYTERTCASRRALGPAGRRPPRRHRELQSAAARRRRRSSSSGSAETSPATDIVDIIFQQPQCARFFAASLLNWFVYNDPNRRWSRASRTLSPQTRLRAVAGGRDDSAQRGFS